MVTSDMIWVAFLSILAVVILSANAYVFFVIYKCKSLRTRSNAFLLSLAFSDLSIALFNLPLTAASTYSPRLRATGSALCNVSGVLEMTFLIASVFSVTAMNFHRYIHIIYWQRYYDLFSVRKVCYLIIFIWASAIALSIPPLLGLSKISYKQGKSHCFVDWKETPGYTFTLMTTCFFVPLFLMGYFYARIYQYRKQSKTELNTISKRLSTRSTLTRSSGKLESMQISEPIGNTATITGVETARVKSLECDDLSSSFLGILAKEKDAQNSLVGQNKSMNYDRRDITPITVINEQTFGDVDCGNSAGRSREDSLGRHNKKTAASNHEPDGRSAKHLQSTVDISLNFQTISGRTKNVSVFWKRHSTPLSTDTKENEKEPEDLKRKLEQLIKGSGSQSFPRNSPSIAVKNFVDQGPAMSSRRKYMTAAERAEKESRKLTIMCSLIVAVFCISWLPFVVTMCLDSLSDIHISVFIDKATLVFGYLNSLANPMIYFYFNRSFRRRFRILNNVSQ